MGVAPLPPSQRYNANQTIILVGRHRRQQSFNEQSEHHPSCGRLHALALADVIRPRTAVMIGTVPLSAATIARVIPQLSLIVSCFVSSSAAEMLRP